MYLPASEGGKKRDKINLISSIGGRKVGEGHSKKRKKEKKKHIKSKIFKEMTEIN